MLRLPTKAKTSPAPSAADQLRSAADEARDRRDWNAAAASYRRYLDVVPDDAGIWVQYGHSLKEQDELVEAEAAYRTAANLRPRDADSRLHLGHVLKRLERPRQAVTTFRELMDIAPTPEIMSELKGLGYEVDVQAALDKSPGKKSRTGRYIELKDLFQYLSLHTTVTGITRVTLGLVNYILEEMDEDRADDYQFVHMHGDAEGLLLFPKKQVRRLVQMAMMAVPDLDAMQQLIGEMRRTSPFTRLRAGDLYMIVGAFWEFEANPTWLGGMKQRGVIVGAYIYDLIPITHAHYCMAALTNAFTAAFADTSRLLDFSLTISEFVAKQVTGYIGAHQIAPFPTRAVPLAHELRFESELVAPDLPVSRTLDVLEGRPFVLCICTIEARKNHIYLFYIWQRLIEAGLPVPDLVFVGRQGWRVQDLLGQIEASYNLGGRLHIMHGLSDTDLSALYDRCLFTVFPSFVEGWGLPVGESLAHGKVCVASSTTSIPEVGGDLAVYIDPFNLESGYQAIRELITDPDRLARLEDRVRREFKPRGWAQVGEDFFAGIDAALAGLDRAGPRQLYAPTLASGTLFRVESLTDVGARGIDYVRNPERLTFTEGWRSIEPSGTWMLDPIARLRLRTDCQPGQAVTILLHVGSSPWVGAANTLRIRTVTGARVPETRTSNRKVGYSRAMRPDRDFWVRLNGQVDETGCLGIEFQVDGAVSPADKLAAAVAMRLFSVGYGAVDDYVARVSLLEEAVLASD